MTETVTKTLAVKAAAGKVLPGLAAPVVELDLSSLDACVVHHLPSGAL